MCGKTRKDRTRNVNIRDVIGVASIEDKLREKDLGGSDVNVVSLLMR